MRLHCGEVDPHPEAATVTGWEMSPQQLAQVLLMSHSTRDRKQPVYAKVCSVISTVSQRGVAAGTITQTRDHILRLHECRNLLGLFVLSQDHPGATDGRITAEIKLQAGVNETKIYRELTSRRWLCGSDGGGDECKPQKKLSTSRQTVASRSFPG